uniref:Uncharacterized protein n=1 Tax=Corethron hystrix TaxID=216773 RepID=A0A7S1BHG0_9STRA
MNDSYQENSVTTSMSDPGSTCCNPDAKNYDGPLHDKVKEIFLNQNDSVSIDSTTMKNLLLSVKKAIKDSDSNNLNLFKKNGNDVELKICLPSQSSEYPEVFINVPSDINQTDSTMNSTANSQSTLHIDEGTQQVHEQAPWYRGSKILEKRSGPETEESVSYFTKVDQRKSSLFNIFRSAMGGHCCGGDISDV